MNTYLDSVFFMIDHLTRELWARLSNILSGCYPCIMLAVNITGTLFVQINAII